MPKIIDKSPKEIEIWLQNNSASLIDVREDHEFTGVHIKNTEVHIPLSRFDPNKIPTDSTKKLVFICAHGVRSTQVGQYLLDEGFIKEAYNLENGIVGWTSEDLPVETD